MTANKYLQQATGAFRQVGYSDLGTAPSTAYNETSEQTAPGSPLDASTASTSVFVMMGLAQNVSLGANTNGRLLLMLTGNCWHSASGSNVLTQLRYGTGPTTMPGPGVALTGTQIGVTRQAVNSNAADGSPITLHGILTGLTTATYYWVDGAIESGAAGTAHFDFACVTMVEL